MSSPHDAVLEALRIPRSGRMFSLESGWWREMPLHHFHPRFEVLSYRTPRGVRVEGDHDYLIAPANTSGAGFVSELIMCTAHSGTHIDAHAHVTGPGDTWHGGGRADEALGDFGPLTGDASELPPLIARGVLLDVPAVLGRGHCPPGFAIGPTELRQAAERVGVTLNTGDVVLVRTGQMAFWPDVARIDAEAGGSGLSLDGACWLVEHGPVAIAGDTVQLECSPSGIAGQPLPVHLFLIHEHGIPILEWVNCEELAAAGVYEFLFLCLPLTIAGATGSLVRPIAIA